MRDLNKFKGCLIGGAVGDALGYTVEFLSAFSIFQKYGKNGITNYELRDGVARISDDTQMTLFTATGLLVGTTRGKTRGIGGFGPDYIGFSYRDWYRTQTESYPLKDKYHYSWLVNVPELFARRAPGMTCLSALEQKNYGTIEKPINQSKGCGGIMRVAPIGIYFAGKKFYSEEMIDDLGARAAALTHGHELGYIPAAMLVHILQRIVNHDESIFDAVQNSLAAIQKIYPKAKHMRELVELIEKAVALSQKEIDDLAAIQQLGEGWVAEETLAIAVYCALKYSKNFAKGIVAAVNHDGDSDSTGAVAGNILGASLGLKKIPKKFIDKLELKDVICEIAEDLYHDCQISEYGSHDELWESKYISMTYKPNQK